jgi:hypothetical protein
MSTEIYDALGYDYEKELQKNSDNFVPLGSKKPKADTIRFSPIVVPNESKTSNIRTSPIVVPGAVKSAMRVSSKRAETPATTTARKAIIKKMPMLVEQQPYDYELNRPFSPIQSSNDEDEEGIFFGGKKRTRKARSTRRKRSRKIRSTRRKQTKKSSSRRYRGRKGR